MNRKPWERRSDGYYIAPKDETGTVMLEMAADFLDDLEMSYTVTELLQTAQFLLDNAKEAN